MATEPTVAPKYNLYDYSGEAMGALFAEWGEKPVHAETVRKALYRARVTDVAQIPDLPKSLQEKLAERTELALPEIVQTQTSADGTKKFLFAFCDGQCVEGVLLAYDHGYTLCLSTQKGCRMGCAFCASSKLPFGGNCAPSEIVGQLLVVEAQENVRIKNLVYMGIGEPLDNADAVKESLLIFTDPLALGIGARHISVSTCGVVPGIRRMAEENWPCQLAVSLHFADDELRAASMPINRRYPLDELLEACKGYNRKTNKILFFEYALLPGVNDTTAHAERLIERIIDIPCRVNLIEHNPITDGTQRADLAQIEAFRETLKRAGIVTTLRLALGQDIDGACGQLRGKTI